MAKQFSGSGFAAAADVMPCSGSVGIVIVAKAIVVPLAGLQHVFINGAAPTAAISRVWKDGWIIATGNESTGASKRERA